VNSPIRKWHTIRETVISEVGAPDCTQGTLVAAAAVVVNPWHGHGWVHDLQPRVREIAPLIAQGLVERILTVLGGPANLESFGKGALVGVDGEIEHGAALIHTPHFGDVYRQAVDGTSIIAFADQRGDAGSVLTVPVWHKTKSATRSHYQTVQVRVPDAPRANEIVIIAAAASGPRPAARIGDRTTDATHG
jgi:hypothetical protein